MDLAGKRAIVIGGTSGIGLATVRQLVAAGAQVIGGSRSQDNLTTAKEEEPGATYVKIDALDRAALESLFAANEGFDILVNAAVPRERAWGPLLDLDLDAYQATFNKFWSYLYSVRLGAPHMAEKGSIVLVSGFLRARRDRARRQSQPLVTLWRASSAQPPSTSSRGASTSFRPA
jgi:NAD(P)-dependent dehydrogenase (short-subunit alcohol dehydrogenase family)